MRIEHTEECRSCNGTGLFQGMAERDGFAVICHKCDGTGAFKFVHEYQPFEKRKPKKGVLRVLQVNPGICLSTGNGHGIEAFGGISHSEWESGKPFPAGSEMRNFTCPAWWYQSANYELRPEWSECGFGAFRSCKYFVVKAKCWDRFDAERKRK